jgi:hypothetical protein
MPERRLPRAAAWAPALLVVLLVGAAVTLAYIAKSTPILRDRVVTALNQRFASQVQLGSLQVEVVPRPKVSGTALALRHNGRTDVPPLITIGSFSGTAGYAGLFATPLHLGSVSLDGLTLRIPPGGMSLSSSGTPTQHPSRKRPSLSVDRIEAGSAWLEIASRNPLKPPRVFDIHELVMTGFRPDTSARFHARLTNPIPEGEIHTDGTFGPWLADRPRETQLQGRYTLDQANLDDIKGLSGTLSSSGQYDGTLERIGVRGETVTPDFAIDAARQPVLLKTRFNAVVDGTNGDTFLNQVEATLINTLILAKGAIVRAREIKGRHVSLDVTVSDGRVEDVLTLAMKPGGTPLTGRIGIKAHLMIPAGPQNVLDRMRLDGTFSLSQARFTSFNVQKRINVLSKRARGDEGADEAASVVSNMSGRFVMRNAAITFSNLAFAVPGARVELAGAYGLRSERMDFKGQLLLDASLADTTSGVKAIAARLVQPFFRRPGGGSRLPIRVAGTRDKPSFGLDFKRAFLPG